MRDGVRLRADVYRPDGSEPVPALAQRIPYGKDLAGPTNFNFDVLRAVRAGYAVVVQDTRGRYQSDGDFRPFEDESADGVDTIAWIASQPWSNGRVGMVGGSYTGATQLLAAAGAPPALQAIAPVLTAADYSDGWVYRGGAFELGLSLWWTLFSLVPEAIRRAGENPDELQEVYEALDEIEGWYAKLPLAEPEVVSKRAPYYRSWIEGASSPAAIRRTSPCASFDSISVAALHIGGWYDCFLGGTLANFRELRSRGEAGSQRLIVGPWSHGVTGPWFPQRRFPMRAAGDVLDLTAVQLGWFDQWLRDSDDAAEPQLPVRLFVMGADEWRSEPDWPLPDTRYAEMFLRSGGRANRSVGNGRLMEEPPADEPPDVYRYDPRDPVPTVGGQTLLPGPLVGANAGPMDQAGVESRADILCYTSDPLDRPVEVTGPVCARLFVSTSARDTDFTVKLVDVHRDGRAEILTDGILRLRFRRGMQEPVPVVPDAIEEIEIDMWATSNRFAAGHRIRVEVSSSNFPRFDRNTNSGKAIGSDGLDDVTVAVNRVYHDRRHPSRIVLPLIERGER